MLKTPESLAEHHIRVRKTARYFSLGSPNGEVSRVWVVCHGYSQLAASFIRYFSVLEDGATYVVAPEGLNLFYLNRFAAETDKARKVGATWMTREDRLAAIDDYVAYLDTLHDEIFDKVNRSRCQLFVLGFSQGCATISRWLTMSGREVDKAILWGGTLPPDLDPQAAQKRLRGTDLTIVVGDKDEFITSGVVEAEEKRLAQWGIPHKTVTFDGGHHLSHKVLESLT